MNTKLEPLERKTSLVAIATEILIWLAASSVAWFALLLFESLQRGVGSLSGSLVLSLSSALQVSIALSLPIVFLHLLGGFLYVRGNSRWLLITTISAAAISAFPATYLSYFLCSGEWISSRDWSWILQIGIFSLVVFSSSIAWLWHLLVVPSSSKILSRRPGFIGRVAGNRLFSFALVIAAISLVLSLHFVSARWLAAYQLLSDAITAITWLVAASLLFKLFCILPVGKNLLLAVSCSWIFLGGVASSIPISLISEGAASTGRLSIATFRLGASAPRTIIKFEIPSPGDIDCSEIENQQQLSLPSFSSANHRNVILITIDALRSDVIGLNIKGNCPTNNISDFFSKAIHCRKASTTYPATLFAIASAFSGRAPSDIVFSESPPKSILAEAGARVDDVVSLIPDSQWFGFPAVDRLILQGSDAERLPNAMKQTKRAVKILEEARHSGRSLLMWIHYYEPHQPYRTHENLYFGEGAVGAYMSEIAFVDLALGKLMRVLENDGWLDDSLIIVFADHGQALGERGYFGHHVYLTNPLTSIPFAFSYPNSIARVLENNISIADISPTVRHFLDLPVRESGEGKSLFVSENFPTPRSVFAEAFPIRGKRLFEFADTFVSGLPGLSVKMKTIQTVSSSYSPKAAVVRGNHRLIVNRVNDAVELYDDKNDPKSEKNIASKLPETVDLLKKELVSWHKKTAKRAACRLLDEKNGTQNVSGESKTGKSRR